jgi:hypothetical protein
MLRIFSLNNKNAIFARENVIGEIRSLSHFYTHLRLFDTLLFLLHFLINYSHHL